ncbi:hypothetical protein D3C81_1746430 [compost metagenome]
MLIDSTSWLSSVAAALLAKPIASDNVARRKMDDRTRMEVSLELTGHMMRDLAPGRATGFYFAATLKPVNRPQCRLFGPVANLSAGCAHALHLDGQWFAIRAPG